MFVLANRKGSTKETYPENQLPEKNIGPKDSQLKKISQDDLTEGKQDHDCQQEDKKISFELFQ